MPNYMGYLTPGSRLTEDSQLYIIAYIHFIEICDGDAQEN